MASQVLIETLLGTQRTVPSAKQTLTPPGWLLRAWACQLGQLLGRLSLEQPMRIAPSPEFPRPVKLRTSLQFSMSSEYSLLSLGVVESPVAWAAVMLDPAAPMAQTPRR